jgi:hypothetical protein
MTIPVPILFRDNRIPTLSIERFRNGVNNRLNRINIEGLEQGDIILSPVDGTIEVDAQAYKDGLNYFYLRSDDYQGENVNILFQGPPLESFISFDKPISKTGTLFSIKKGQQIGKVATLDKNLLHITLTGSGPLIEGFDLAATSGEKAVLLKK